MPSIVNPETTIKVKWNLKRTRYAELSDGTKILIPQDIRLAYRRLQRRLEKIPTMKPGNTRDTYLLVTDNLQLNLAMKTFRWINRIYNYLSKQWYTTIVFTGVKQGSNPAINAAWQKFEREMQAKARRMGKGIVIRSLMTSDEELSEIRRRVHEDMRRSENNDLTERVNRIIARSTHFSNQ